MSEPLFIDFWRDNPFRDLDLEIPPVPRGDDIASRVKKKGASIRAKLDELNGQTSPEAIELCRKLEADKSRLDELRKELIKKADEMRQNLAFDTLLSVQSPVPRLFGSAALRCAAGAAIWRESSANSMEPPLSDTDREDFGSDMQECALLDRAMPPSEKDKAKGAKAR